MEQPLKRLMLVATFFLSACGGHAGPFRVMPLEALSPDPQAQALFYVVPFEDRRKQAAIHLARSRYENVLVEAVGLSLTAQAWQQRPYGGMALLWHRQLAQALAATDAGARASDEPVPDEAAALRLAGDAGARYVILGRLTRLEIDKKGADPLMGTAFSGMNYPMTVEARVKVLEVASGQLSLDKPWTYQRRFYDPTRMGAPNHKTFPGFFSVGIQDAAAKLAGWDELRAVAGLAAFTPTPTPTLTPLTAPPTPGPSPTPIATAVPTPDTGPYWVNPKTGKRVDPDWNFDPADGTPRKEFILRQAPEAKPTPVRPTGAR
jgi:hypothetical protein